MQSPPPQTKVLNDVENFYWLLDIPKPILLGDYQVDINVGVNKVAVCRAPHRPLDAHQAMLLCPLENGFWLEDFGVAWRMIVFTNPANVFAPPEPPLLQTGTPHVKT